MLSQVARARFSWLSNVPHAHIHAHIFTRPSTDGHTACFCALVTVSHAAGSRGAQAFFRVLLFAPDKYQQVEILGHMVLLLIL